MLDGYRTLARVAAFVALVGFELWLARSASEGGTFRGFIETHEYRITSIHAGILKRANVSLGQQVLAGDVIAEVKIAAVGDGGVAGAGDIEQLTAPADGVVESIDAHLGEPVGPTAPFATVVEHGARSVIACVPEPRMGDVALGSSAEVRTLTSDRRVHGVVKSLTLSVALLPPRCQGSTKASSYGRLAVIALDADAGASPGQATLISFGAPPSAAGGS